MALIASGKKFVRDLEEAGALGVYVPLEGGFEGRYQRRARARGYTSLNLTCRGLGDLAAYFTSVHGVRPPHLGKRDFGDGAVGPVYYLPPVVTSQLDSLPPNSKGLLLWLMEGSILSRQEIEYLTVLPKSQPRVKVVVEMGGARSFQWKPLKNLLVPA
jgi:NAD(P)H-quinone oxidoreductase subunit N